MILTLLPDAPAPLVCLSSRPSAPPLADAQVRELTRRLVAGEESAFSEFHARYFDRLYRLALVISRGNEVEAADTVQDTMVRVARYARTFPSEEVFWGWLSVVLRSAARDAGRKNQRRASFLERFRCSFSPPPPLSDEEARLNQCLEEALRELTQEERILVESKYADGLRTREIAAQAGFSEKAVESRLARLRATLRESILKKLQDYE